MQQSFCIKLINAFCQQYKLSSALNSSPDRSRFRQKCNRSEKNIILQWECYYATLAKHPSHLSKIILIVANYSCKSDTTIKTLGRSILYHVMYIRHSYVTGPRSGFLTFNSGPSRKYGKMLPIFLTILAS